MNINVCVCNETLHNLEEYLDRLKLNILHEIGKNYLDKNDYRELIRCYSNNILTDIIDLIKIDILDSIFRNYCDSELSLDILIDEFI